MAGSRGGIFWYGRAKILCMSRDPFKFTYFGWILVCAYQD